MRTPLFSGMLAALLLIGTMACEKAKIVRAPASVNIVHAMLNGNAIVPRFGSDTSGRYYSSSVYGATMLSVFYGSSQLYSPVAGDNSLLIVPITDTAFKIFDGNLQLESGGIYSLFLSGDTAHADTLLVKDNIPSYADSAAGIRFVNLSAGGKALTINLAGDPSTFEFPALGYKQITNFKKYNGATDVGGMYTFEIRDQASGDLLATYYWLYPVYKNNTIAIIGSTDPNIGLNFITVNNY